MCTGAEVFFLAAASTATTAYTQVQAGRERRRAAEFEAGLKEQDAAAAREEASLEADKIRKAKRYQVGEARADLAASGVSAQAGTPLRIFQEIDRRAEEDAYQALLFGERKGSRFQQEAVGLRMAGANAARQGIYNAAGSVLGAGADIGREGWRRRLAASRSRGVIAIDE